MLMNTPPSSPMDVTMVVVGGNIAATSTIPPPLPTENKVVNDGVVGQRVKAAAYV